MASLIGKIGNELGVKTPEERDYYKSARALMGNMSRSQARNARKTLGMSKGEFSDYVGTLVPKFEISDADMSGLEMPAVTAQPELKQVNYFEEEVDPEDDVAVPKPTPVLTKKPSKAPTTTVSMGVNDSNGQVLRVLQSNRPKPVLNDPISVGELNIKPEPTRQEQYAQRQANLKKAVDSVPSLKDAWLNFYHKYWNSNNSGTMGRSGMQYHSTR